MLKRVTTKPDITSPISPNTRTQKHTQIYIERDEREKWIDVYKNGKIVVGR